MSATAIISVKAAAEAATNYFQMLMENKIADVWLEEVELSSDESEWIITLSALAPGRQTSGLGSIMAPTDGRIYRVFEVDSVSKKVKSMKARKSPE